MRLVLSSIVLAALAANPCLAKDGHAQHGVRASAANNGASEKGAIGNGAIANPAPSKVDAPIDAETPVAPPVLPPRGTQQQIRIINPSAKTANPGNSPGSRAGATTTTAPIARNAIGQRSVLPKNLSGAQPPLPALQRSGAVSPPIIRGGPAPIGTARVNVLNAANRGSVNGAPLIRPATGPSVIGGPAQAHYGINGTTVQNRH